ncbi:TetR/AcrR family transcriptional regulator [Oceanicella actignis]|uniref:Transcriptional regulator, TetR family n=1 Tax=Oceanicella actignis TaxID=1189325 RepID=A0A1M7TZA1_9RHOB|nr:TetR/AcrR family transcriptional regulator [Oceanicella actignis]SET83022.1 transcriptional regulator, TetR family [Oceanicella actignis]SHN76049.1 transcriptional regulator, TetR family [Oceanicella actignis]
MTGAEGAPGGGRKGYHHGNLREALVEAACALIARKGPHGFTFAEAAREAGVSPAAPYRHFKDREALLAEVARRGFALFADLLEHARTMGGPSPLAAFEAVWRAYLAFARREPAYYVAMFESGIRPADDPALQAASDRAMAAMTAAAEALIARLPPDRRPPALMVSMHVWALAHGVVELVARQDAGLRAPWAPDELLESGALVYLRGLGVLREDEAPGGAPPHGPDAAGG